MRHFIYALGLACLGAVPAFAEPFLANRGVRVLPVDDIV